MPVECVEIQEWVEEEVTKPVEKWVEKSEKKCKKWPWPLNWACKLVTTVVKVVTLVVKIVGKWVIRTVCKIVGVIINSVKELSTGLWDVVAGIFTWDGRRILDGLIQIITSIIDNFLKLFRVFTLLDTLDFIVTEIERKRLKAYVRAKLSFEYTGEQLQRMIDFLRIDYGAFGYRIPMRAIRTYLDSETPSPTEPRTPNLVVLHEQEEINLYELCGFQFPQGFWNRKRYKTLKKELVVGGGGGEFDNPLSKGELDTYLSTRGVEGPKFIVLSMRDEVLKTKLRCAELKAREIGLMPIWTTERLEVTQVDSINHKGYDTNEAATSLVDFLVDVVHRKRKVRNLMLPNGDDQVIDDTDAVNELCTPIAVGVFRYTDTLRGLAGCLQGSSCQSTHDASGVTFIDNIPDIIWKYVPIHELGHYFGLCHVDGIDRVMYSPKENSWFDWWTLPKLFLTKGEPSFTLKEGFQTWDYIIEHFPPHCLEGASLAEPDIE